MGSPDSEVGRISSKEGPRHEVTLTRGFWMTNTPITHGFYKAVMGNRGDRGGFQELCLNPVADVTYSEATLFCESLERILQATGFEGDDLCFRLPTEAEWEYACRAGTTTATYAGGITLHGYCISTNSIAWFEGNSGGVAHTVGLNRANPWGLQDTLGNVLEWCQDILKAEEYSGEPQIDPLGVEGPYHVIRGGGFQSDREYVRAAARVFVSPDYRHKDLGFRICRGP